MIGTGVFTTAGFQIRDLQSGPLILLSWLLGGASALCGALCYAELASALPRNGGDYHLLGRIYHPAVGVAAGWISLVVGFAAPVAAAALAFGDYLGVVVPGVGGPVVGIVLVIVMSVVHASDVERASATQNALTVPKVVGIALFAVVCIALGEPSRIAWTGEGEGAGGTTAFAVGLVFVYYAYSGWNGAVYVAGELKDPARDLPRSLFVGTWIVTVLYVGLNAAFLAAAPPEALSGQVEVGAIAAQHVLGDVGGQIAAGLIALGLVSAVGAMIMAGPRIYATMGEDYARLRFLAGRGDGRGPVAAVALQGGLAVGMMLVADIDEIFVYAGLALSFVSGLAVLGVIVLRFREPELERPYRTLGYPITPLLFVGFMGWMIATSVSGRPDVAPAAAGTVASGLGLYLLVRGGGDG